MQCGGWATFLTCINAQGEKKFFACGDNQFGQLGLGYMSDKVTVPEEVKLKPQIPYCLPERGKGASPS